MDEMIKLSHGDGGMETHWLINNVFNKYFNNLHANTMPDSFVFETGSRKLAYTTDSFVVKPLFFRGGDIGKLAVCGTVNDLAAAGAIPLCLSAGFIIEEGFSINDIHIIAKSMSEVCGHTGAKIVTGDTKVVEKGSVDGIFINTSGIGIVSEHYQPGMAEPGDEIIITGGIAEHGTAILIDRYDLGLETWLESDCGPLSALVEGMGRDIRYVKLMKDPTRGGLAAVLNEIACEQGLNIELNENSIPIKKEVRAINEILGIDPLSLACEGRMVIIVQKGFGERILKKVKTIEGCGDAQIIGCFAAASVSRSMVYMITGIGGKRIVPMPEGRMLPRIC